MRALPPQIAERCAKIVGQLSSDNEGTVLAAGRALVSTLKGVGLGITDLSNHIAEGPRETIRYIERAPRPEPAAYPFGSWREAGRPRTNSTHRYLVVRCQNASAGRLNEWEAGFLLSLAQQLAKGRPLSAKQVGILDSIAERLGVSAA
jgi:hypothetical protein